MSDITLPCWSFPPDWGNGILEALEWKSSVSVSPKGAEQRRMLRLSPRRFLEFQVLGLDSGRSNLDLAVWSAGGTTWNLPLWWDYAKLTAAASASATVLMMNTAYSEFEAGGLAFVQGPDYEVFDVVEIVSVAADRLNLVAPGTSRAWGAGTRVYPIRQAEFTDQPQLTRHNDNVATYQCSFQVTEKNVFGATPPADTYLGYRVYRTAPNETGTLSTQWSRMLAAQDNGSAIPYRVDTARYGFAHQQHEFFIKGRQEHVDFRRLLYWLRGRVRPVWLPTFSIDMRLLSAVGSGATTLTIEKVGVAQYVNFAVDPDHPEYAYPGRRHIMIHLRDGSAVFALMNNAVDNLDGTETVTLSAPVGVAIDPEDIKRVSFMALMRLDQDRVEINHLTDQAGVSQSRTVFVSTPENRQADAWGVDDWQGIMTSETCTLCEPPSIVRLDDILFEAGGFNPMTNEVWAMASGNDPDGGIMGYRFLAGSLEMVDEIRMDCADLPVYQYFQGAYSIPTFIPDAINDVMWCVGQLRVNPTTVKHCIFKVDMATGVTLAAKTPTGTGVNASAVNWHLFIHPVTGDPWLACPSSGSIYMHRLSLSTLQPVESYSMAHAFFHARMDALGNIYYLRQNSALNHGEIWKFNTTTHSFAQVYLDTVNPPYEMVMHPTQAKMFIVGNIIADGIDEFNTSTDALTGHNIPQPPFSGGENCRYDEINNVIWGLEWNGSHLDGFFTGIRVSDGSTFGTFDPRTPKDTVVGEMVNKPMVPVIVGGVSSPNALYVESSKFFDPPADTDFGYALSKIPMCNIVPGA